MIKVRHGWTYDAENDYYGRLYEALADYMDCGFCDRLFRPNAAGNYEGITRINGPLDDPDDSNSGRPVQESVTSAGRATGRLVACLAWSGQ